MKKQPLRLTHRESAEFYGVLCDIIYRDHAGIPDEDPFMHTSSGARQLASKIEERLALEGYLEYR